MGSPMSETVSVQEMTWTLVAGSAIGFTLWILNDNVRNYGAIREAVRRDRAVAWGPRWWVAFASLVSSAAMLVVWFGFVVIGIIAMSTPPPLTSERQVAVETNGWILIAIEVLLAAIQAWQVYARTKIRPILPLGQPPTPEDVDMAADQTRYAADLVDALRLPDDAPERGP